MDRQIERKQLPDLLRSNKSSFPFRDIIHPSPWNRSVKFQPQMHLNSNKSIPNPQFTGKKLGINHSMLILPGIKGCPWS